MCRRTLSSIWEEIDAKRETIERFRKRKAMRDILEKQMERFKKPFQRPFNGEASQ